MKIKTENACAFKYYMDSKNNPTKILSDKNNRPLRVTQGTPKGKRLDRWIEVREKSKKVLYQCEIKNWSATAIGGEFEIQADYIDSNNSVSKEYSNTIKTGEIIETSLITKAGESISLNLITPKVEEIVPVLASIQNSSSKSGSGHRGGGEVLGMSTTADNQTELQLKLIELLKKLISLYMLLLKK